VGPQTTLASTVLTAGALKPIWNGNPVTRGEAVVELEPEPTDRLHGRVSWWLSGLTRRHGCRKAALGFGWIPPSTGHGSRAEQPLRQLSGSKRVSKNTKSGSKQKSGTWGLQSLVLKFVRTSFIFKLLLSFIFYLCLILRLTKT
jgi:hypothetical protein